MPENIKRAAQTLVNYTYLWDGTKVRALDASGHGYEYIGSLRFSFGSSGLTPESLPFSAGRIVATSNGFEPKYYVTDHLGSTRVILNQNGSTSEAVFDYMPYGTQHRVASSPTSDSDFRFTGKELQGLFGLDELYDSAARFQSNNARFLSPDPLSDLYYGYSPYAYCAGNPINLIDPDGRKIDTSKLTEEQKEEYEKKLNEVKHGKFFNTMYSSLQASDKVYVIQFGQTTIVNGEQASGEFNPNENGGTITFLEGAYLSFDTMGEELFHGFQHENRDSYEKGEFNLEFEAKLATIAMAADAGNGFASAIGQFGQMIGNGLLNMPNQPTISMTPGTVKTEGFVGRYKKEANAWAQQNIKNNHGNLHYKKKTTVSPYSLQKMVINANRK